MTKMILLLNGVLPFNLSGVVLDLVNHFFLIAKAGTYVTSYKISKVSKIDLVFREEVMVFLLNIKVEVVKDIGF